MILLLASLGVALFYFSWVFKMVADWIHQYPLVKKLPGPKGLPVIGSVMDVIGDTTVPLLFFLDEAKKARARGEQTLTVNIIGRIMTLPLNGAMVKAIVESNDLMAKGKDYDFLSAWVGVDSILITSAEIWKDSRKRLTPMFHYTMLEGYMDTFNKHAHHMVEVLKKERLKGPVDMRNILKGSSLDIIVDTTMGCNFSFLTNPDHPYIHAVDTFTNYVQRHSMEPQMWINWIWFLFYHRECHNALNEMHKLTDEVLKGRANAVKTGDIDLDVKRKPLIDQFLVLEQQGKMSMKLVHFDINGVILGGHDTTSATLTWIFWSLACLPEMQQRCFEEIELIFGGDRDRDCTPEDLKELEYTDRFIKESMRMFAPAPLVQRGLQKDFQLGEAILPRGSDIFMNVFVIHHNEEVYPDNWQFDPDRFLPEEVAKRHPYDYIPFSAGIRNCLGQKFAMQEIKVIVATALRKFSFSTDRDLLDQGFATEVVLKPTNGCNLTVTPR
ncbi:hypothetical protein PENTCL1PPCAC_18714 [Pristionchus entomophagus]|uniref:Cytochrome P450 n=1 Tax=Pristionchus entomophagus TaxID=358040 RepID=A0AAV5TQ44_9BILA|nr:hypothetical protein PENTCL1PPCAC_18714 [Pristionchus entomophagus]